MNRLREYQRGTLGTDGGHIVSAGTLPGTDSVYSWTLDSVGNWRRTSRTPAGGAAVDEIRTHNKLHQVVKAGDVELAYDKSGNMTDDGSRTFEYDAFNRIRTVKRKADSLTIGEYCYDAHGRRIRKTVSNGGLGGGIANGTTDYLYAGNQCVEERNSSNTPTRQFVWGLYIDELIQLREDVSTCPVEYYPLQDLLYRTTALTDSTGGIAETYDTDAYGRTLAFFGTGPDCHWFTDDDVPTCQPRCEYIFTGRQYDPESQLYYYRARYYNPALGRFLRRDASSPLTMSYSSITHNGLKKQYADWTNLYQYVRGNPLSYIDPDGLTAKKCKWRGSISGSFTGTFFGGYATVRVIATGTDGNCNYGVSGRGTQWFGGAAFGIGYFSASVEFDDYEATCEWPISNGTGAALTILGAGGNAGIPINLSEVIGAAGSFRATGFCASGGLNVFIAGAAWGALLEGVDHVGPTPREN
jgi:RHS repeat-associated protein